MLIEIVEIYSTRPKDQLIDVRLRELHIIHNAFKTGAEKTDW